MNKVLLAPTILKAILHRISDILNVRRGGLISARGEGGNSCRLLSDPDLLLPTFVEHIWATSGAHQGRGDSETAMGSHYF